MTKKFHIACLIILLSVGIPLSYAFGLTNVLNIRRWTAPDHTRVVIDVSDAISYQSREAGRIVSINLENTVLSDTLPREYLVEKPAVKKIRLTSLPGDAVRVDLYIGDDVTVNIFTLGPIKDIKPHRIVIDVKLPEVEKKESEERKQVKIQEKRKIVVIDPGHGGEDPGAVGRRGTKEKDIVLKVARELRDALKKKGYQAYLTREGDYYISFKKRLEIAREYGADLFISIHTDAHRSRGARGASVYCLSTGGASSEAARLLARDENLSDIIAGVENGENNGEAGHIMLNMLQTETINQSKYFGVKILEDLGKVNHLKYSRVHEAPFRILKLPEIPSILVEIAYISNPREESLLRKRSYQKEVAWALASSVSGLMPLPPSLARNVPSEKADKPVVPSGQTFHGIYVVKRGDILSRIAEKHGTSVGMLKLLNKLKRSDVIFVGQKLKVSSAGTAAAGDFDVYTVERGDMLEKIAERYNTTADVIMSANNLRSADRIYVGQRLKIPAMQGDGEDGKGRAVRPSVYVVKRGDTLEEIAQRHDTTVTALVSINDLNDKNTILKGQELSLREPGRDKNPVVENTGANSSSQPTPLHDTIEAVIDHDIKVQLKAIKDSNAQQANAVQKDNASERGADDLAVAESSPEESELTVHIVQRGEMLDLIARRYNTTTARLMALNDIKRKDRIFVNQRLKVPAVRGGETEDAAESAEISVYVVQRGDSLARIAHRYNTTIGVLLKLNGLNLNDTLYVNQRIKVLSGGRAFSVYVVKKGDFLSKIAGRHGTTAVELLRINNLESQNRIYVGQRLRVPVL
jgi:N-acetylmuramoyl-L-alanine amidase